MYIGDGLLVTLFLMPIEATAVEARKFDIDGNFMSLIEHCVLEVEAVELAVARLIGNDIDLFKSNWLGRLGGTEGDLVDRRAYEGDLFICKSSSEKSLLSPSLFTQLEQSHSKILSL